METPFPHIEEKINSITPKKNKINFNIFNSALFLSDYQENEDNSSDNNNKGKILSKSNSIKSKENSAILNEIPSFDFNYLSNELMNIIDKDSNSNIIGNEKENKIQDFPKIGSNLLKQSNIPTYEKNKNLNTKINNVVYKENINGIDYQLKFIENSLNKILPQSYHKSLNVINNNLYNNSYFNHIAKTQINSTKTYPNKFNINNNNSFVLKNRYNYNSNNGCYPFISNINNTNRNGNVFIIHSSINKNNINNSGLNNINLNKYQIHQLKVGNNKYDEWKCNNCNLLNRGYRNSCFNCKNNKKGIF